jgi:hypothetical protein
VKQEALPAGERSKVFQYKQTSTREMKLDSENDDPEAEKAIAVTSSWVSICVVVYKLELNVAVGWHTSTPGLSVGIHLYRTFVLACVSP